MLQKFAEFLNSNHALEDYCFNLSKKPPEHLEHKENDVWWIFSAFTWPHKEYTRWNMLDQNWLHICRQYNIRNTNRFI